MIFFIFYKESKSKKRKKIYFCFLCLGGGGRGRGLVSDFFYKESKSTHFVWGVEWKG